MSLTLSHSILIWKLRRYGLKDQTVKWNENWLDLQAQINALTPLSEPLTSKLTQGLLLRPVRLNALIINLDNEKESTLSKFSADNKFGQNG